MSLRIPKYHGAIDGDGMVYRVAFAAANDPIDHALHSVKVVVEDALRNSGCVSHTLYLGHPSLPTFRHNLATLNEYKQGRSPRPEYYEPIRKYLLNKFNTEICIWYEADDAVSIAAYKRDDVVIITNDKDLNTVPGKHYNWVKKKSFDVSEFEARYNFWTQMIQGDATDNIQALRGLRYRAKKVLEDCETEEEFRATVFELYKKHFPTNASEVFNETGVLLHMLRYEEDYWDSKLR